MRFWIAKSASCLRSSSKHPSRSSPSKRKRRPLARSTPKTVSAPSTTLEPAQRTRTQPQPLRIRLRPTTRRAKRRPTPPRLPSRAERTRETRPSLALLGRTRQLPALTWRTSLLMSPLTWMAMPKMKRAKTRQKMATRLRRPLLRTLPLMPRKSLRRPAQSQRKSQKRKRRSPSLQPQVTTRKKKVLTRKRAKMDSTRQNRMTTKRLTKSTTNLRRKSIRRETRPMMRQLKWQQRLLQSLITRRPSLWASSCFLTDFSSSLRVNQRIRSTQFWLAISAKLCSFWSTGSKSRLFHTLLVTRTKWLRSSWSTYTHVVLLRWFTESFTSQSRILRRISRQRSQRRSSRSWAPCSISSTAKEKMRQ